MTASYWLASGGINPSLAGTEVPNSRRLLFFPDLQWARCSYAGGGLLGDCRVGLAASLDNGATWGEFVPYGPLLAAAGTVLATEWTDVSQWAAQGDVLVAAVAQGAALSLGLLYQLAFIELQVR